MKDLTPSEALEAVSALAEPARRALYEYVAAAPDAVGRDQAAEAVGVSRQAAAYHLDRLADDGLLSVEYRRLTGRSGPGAGRPSKLYRRSDRTYQVSIPPRRYELAALILLEAIASGEVERATIGRIAREAGRRLATSDLGESLERVGYEPEEAGGETRFRNCPFHELKERDRPTTCQMNLALVQGLIEGADADATAVLAPEEGYCCVRIR
jgi:predicted ArsR family transcriptional regulator